MAKLVESVYGDALFELAIEQNRVDDYAEEAKGLVQVLEENPQLSQLMAHPQVTKEEKLEMIDNIFKGKVSGEVLGLLRTIIEKNHFSDTKEVFTYFLNRVKEHKNIGVATVSTPLELTDAQKKDVESKLLETTKYVSFEINYVVDPELIGGMVIRIGDRVVDSSIKTKIYNLSRDLSKIQLKVGEGTP
ncbi:MAG: ATP synthase F1 subunit delta [Lachnospiraceae bacterium]|nr:ATP synthase F1 subunit delta [Lachnospiraceae bacterium]